jgi:hypothetical protein
MAKEGIAGTDGESRQWQRKARRLGKIVGNGADCTMKMATGQEKSTTVGLIRL